MMPRRLSILGDAAEGVRHLPPDLKRKARSVVDAIRWAPEFGKALGGDLAGLHSARVGRFRMIYRILPSGEVEVLAIGPRETIYQDMARIASRRTSR